MGSAKPFSVTDLRRELKREYSYFTGEMGDAEYVAEPAMFIYREMLIGVSVCIPLPLAWTYNEQEKLGFREVTNTVRRIGNMLVHLGYEPDMDLISQFWHFVQDGLDDLMKVPPAPQNLEVVGEMDLWIDGKKQTREIIVDTNAENKY